MPILFPAKISLVKNDIKKNQFYTIFDTKKNQFYAIFD